jgi:glycosyltransferase involved in cell wall biosynthesis
MKILLSAYACEPNCGSEPGVGWNMAKTIARRHQVHVLTSSMHRAGVEAELARFPDPNIQFTYFDPFDWVYDWSGSLHWIHLHYFLWQIKAYQIARPLHRLQSFDLVHHVTYCTYLKSSFLVYLPVPFVWGPLGGGESTPSPLFKALDTQEQWKERFRSLVRTVSVFNPFLRLTILKSSICWAATDDTAKQLLRLGHRNVHVLSSVLWLDDLPNLKQGAAEYSDSPDSGYVSNSPELTELGVIRFMSIGRLISWKGFHLSLQAFAEAALPNSEYWIVGNGPELPKLQQMAKQFNIIDRVHFLGGLNHSQTLEKLNQIDVLVHPSMHDSGGFVCIEAMAYAKPVICLDVGGPPLQVTELTGYKIKPDQPAVTVSAIASAMKALAEDPALREKMGLAAHQRVRAVFSPSNWETFLDELYAAVDQRTSLKIHDKTL